MIGSDGYSLSTNRTVKNGQVPPPHPHRAAAPCPGWGFSRFEGYRIAGWRATRRCGNLAQMDRSSDSSAPIETHRPSHEEVARHAYALWERDGRRDDSAAADEYWFIAERELVEVAEPSASAKSRGRKEEAEEEEPGRRPPDVPATNLDRALPVAERQAKRAAREPAKPRVTPRQAPPVFIVVDSANFRAYRETRPLGRDPGLVQLEAFGLTLGHEGPYDRDSDQAGRFGRVMGTGGVTGGSFDERLPMKDERERRLVRQLTTAIERCLATHGATDWYLAAGPRLQHAILAGIQPAVRLRLRGAVTKDLVKQSKESILQHFASASKPGSSMSDGAEEDPMYRSYVQGG